MRQIFLLIFVIPSLSAYSQEYNFIEDSFRTISGDSVVEKIIVELVNHEREKNGLSALRYDYHLQSAARQHSQDMLKHNYFSHSAPSKELQNPGDRVYQTGLSDCVVGENIAVHSLEGSSDAIAQRLMDQWMNSPGHRANILKPEFTGIGVGAVSAKDSTVRDTLIQGRRSRVVIYSIRHFGTQVFVSRRMTFSALSVKKISADILIFDLQLQSDRGMLAVFNNYTQFFEPVNNKITLHVEYPASDSLNVNLAYVQNAHTKEYINFFRDRVAVQSLIERLNQIKFPVIGKEIKIVLQEKYFLQGDMAIARGDTGAQYLIYVDDDRYYELPVAQDRVSFSIPMDTGRSHTIAFAAGSGTQKTVTNQLMLDLRVLKEEKNKTDEVSKRIFKKFIP